MQTLIILAGMSAREQIDYASKMIALVDERIACRAESKIPSTPNIERMLQELLNSKAHYIVLLESGKARLDMF